MSCAEENPYKSLRGPGKREGGSVWLRGSLAVVLAGVCWGVIGCQSAADGAADGVRAVSYRKRTVGTSPVAAGPEQGGEAAGGAGAAPAEASDGYIVPVPHWTRRWSRLLGRVVSPQTGRVDYAYLRRNPRDLNQLVEELAPPREFEGRAQRLAFLLNAYNAMTVAAAVREYPLSSVRDVDGFFSEPAFELLGERRALDEVRDGLIRPMGDPCVHMAMTYAAMGGPRLRPVAYTAARLDEQLGDQTRDFLASRQHNASIGGVAMLSPLFDWFARDFRAGPNGSVLGFVRHHAGPDTPLGRLLSRPGEPRVTYLQFNWALNGR